MKMMDKPSPYNENLIRTDDLGNCGHALTCFPRRCWFISGLLKNWKSPSWIRNLIFSYTIWMSETCVSIDQLVEAVNTNKCFHFGGLNIIFFLFRRGNLEIFCGLPKYLIKYCFYLHSWYVVITWIQLK